ncbi:helicase HerA domain-containing protein [Bacillus mycoides]|uniref:helicase HerA domain-containing protein n=1 Tax=Bacillus mycoides TaxID=1405 RepID=UPI001C02387E|nr:DUF87 domain-containing protein [Bacillus mycoides]QWG88561.1 DUF87 domain-containing protein [Bacillus mycoides]QWJ07330.1 DUF87 domain-containing protein [Bacillus mycoides]
MIFNPFFRGHISILGNTGSGKSTTVRKLLHEIVHLAEKEKMNIKSTNFVISLPFLELLYRHQNKRTSDSTLWLCAKHKLVEVLYFLSYASPPCTKNISQHFIC